MTNLPLNLTELPTEFFVYAFFLNLSVIFFLVKQKNALNILFLASLLFNSIGAIITLIAFINNQEELRRRLIFHFLLFLSTSIGFFGRRVQEKRFKDFDNQT